MLAFIIAAAACHSALALDPVRLGWQTPWATQGQLVATLQKTNIPEVTGLAVEYVGFSYGAPLNRAALSGQVDILLTADQPAAALIDKGDKFRVVARMMRNRTCMYTHPQHGPRSLADLRSARLFGPTGAAAERVALRLIQQAGVDTRSLTMGDLDMAGQGALLRSNDSGQWKGVDALYGFDPLPQVWMQTGRVRMLGCGEVVSFIVASREILENRPQIVVAFLRAFTMAWFHYARNPLQANVWFNAIASLDIPDSALEAAAAVEPNKSARKLEDVDLEVLPADVALFDEAVAFLKERNQVKPQFSAAAAIDTSLYKTVKQKPGDIASLYKQVRAK